MDEQRAKSGGRVLNVGLALGGLLLLVLLYGLVGSLFSGRSQPVREAAQASGPVDIVQVEVRNASGVPSATRRVTLYLRQQGFDVVEAGGAASEQPRSSVIDRVGNPDAARRVAVAVGLPESQIVREVNPDLLLDVSLVLGADYEGLKPFGNE